MTDCEEVRESLVLYAEGELPAEQSRSIQEHLARCVSCRQEASVIRQVRSWLLNPDLFLPQDDPWDLLPSSLASRAKGRMRRWVPLKFGSLAWAAGVAAFAFWRCTTRATPQRLFMSSPISSTNTSPCSKGFMVPGSTLM